MVRTISSFPRVLFSIGAPMNSKVLMFKDIFVSYTFLTKGKPLKSKYKNDSSASAKKQAILYEF
jgi:hypothetical protein